MRTAPKGFTLLLGVVLAAMVIGVVVGGALLFRHQTSTTTNTSNANAALNLACSVDADCSSYCGGDQCYQPICGTTTIGGTGSCTCRSLCGPIAPAANTNANANVNASTNANTNSTASTAGWKTYEFKSKTTNVKFAFSHPPTVGVVGEDDSIVISWSDKSQFAFENPQYQVDLFSSASLEIGEDGVKETISSRQVQNCSADGVNGIILCPEPAAAKIMQKQTTAGLAYNQFMTTMVNQVLSNGRVTSESSKPMGPYMYLKDPYSFYYVFFSPAAPVAKFPSGYQETIEKILSTLTFTK